MLKSGRTTFSKIAGLVNREGGSHRITSRVHDLREKRNKRLEALGVRPLDDGKAYFDDLPAEQKKVYEKAYDALKSSGKSWATHGEIRDILFSDKELSHDRSSEVIEILREADVPGFEETDEVTAGDKYSERILGVIHKQERRKETLQRRERLTKLISRDKEALENKPNAELSAFEKGGGFGSLKIVKLQGRDEAPEPYGGQAHIESQRPANRNENQSGEENDNELARRIPLPHEHSKSEVALPTVAEKLGLKNESKNPAETKTPLAFGIEDSDLQDEKDDDENL